SVHGPFPFAVSHDAAHLFIEGQSIRILKEKEPLKLPWDRLNIDVVIESTGVFTTKEKASFHLEAGAKQTIISAPSSDREVPTVVLGVNDTTFNWHTPLFSNASCTTNNVAPPVKILADTTGIEAGHITMVQSMTADQYMNEAPHRH